MASTAPFASFVVAVVGAILLWANPRRSVNRAIFCCSMNVAAWLACGHMAVAAAGDRGLHWLRLTYSVGALIPLSLWLIKESIIGTWGGGVYLWVRKNVLWIALPVALTALPLGDSFIPSYSSDENRIRGVAYYAYYIGIVGLYGALIKTSIYNIRPLTGARRIELQVWLYGGCIAAAVVYVLIGVGALTDSRITRPLQPIAVLTFYVITAYAITSYRIFDARQIVLIGIEKMTLVIGCAATAYVSYGLMDNILAGVPLILVTIVIILFTASKFGYWLDRKFNFIPQEGVARQVAFATAQRETRLENLESSFLNLLKGWAKTEKVTILSGSKDSIDGGGERIPVDNDLLKLMRDLKWVTPERLSRERMTPERRALVEFLAASEFGLLVIGEGAMLTVLIGVGVSVTRVPYTYPQVTQILELTSIIHSALERAHYSTKAQHAEQLATVGLLGASLAHEIRNPLVSIKTFVQLLPTHHHEPAFREKFFQLISEEVGRIDQLTEQLLDLASPRAYAAELIDLHPLLKSSLDLISAKAAYKRVHLHADFAASPDQIFTDGSAAKQVILNLCFNAIQAAEGQIAEARWVKIATRNLTSGVELSITDSGPGIAPEIRPRLFQPFQTTKSSGFGLGLAICSDILANLNASITVDPPSEGCGATFRVTFPCKS